MIRISNISFFRFVGKWKISLAEVCTDPFPLSAHHYNKVKCQNARGKERLLNVKSG